jgi:hypothetical protein
MIKRNTVGDAATTIVSCKREAAESQLPHHSNHVVCHGSLRIPRVVRARRRATAASIATKIGTDHGKLPSQQRSYGPPHQMCLRKAMQ